MKSPKPRRYSSSAAECRAKQWAAGTILRGTEYHGTERRPYTCEIQITAVGERGILAKCLLHNEQELNWTLSCRQWRKVKEKASAYQKRRKQVA